MTTTTAKRITLATLKSFIRKNRSNLLIQTKSRFDGICDGVREVEGNEFTPVRTSDNPGDNNVGLCGVWFVHGSGNSFTPFDDGSHVGYEVWNCCGSFILAIAK